MVTASEAHDDGDAEDARLVALVKRGDAASFDALVKRHLKSALAVAFRIVRNREDAEDVVQDTFIRVLKSIDGFDSSRPFRPWFFRILRNQAINTGRSQHLRGGEDIPPALASGAEGPDAVAESAEWASRFAQALGALSSAQRTVVELHDIEGYSSVEIGVQLGMPSPTVRWHLQQARAKLRVSLQSFSAS